MGEKTRIWGSPLWKLLHAIGSYSGTAADKLRIDEKRELHWLISHLEMVVPCKECRAHIIKYRTTIKLPETNEAAQYFWDFHEAVNKNLGKASGPPLEDVPKANPRNEWKEYQKVINQYVLKGYLTMSAINDFGRHLGLWASFANCF